MPKRSQGPTRSLEQRLVMNTSPRLRGQGTRRLCHAGDRASREAVRAAAKQTSPLLCELPSASEQRLHQDHDSPDADDVEDDDGESRRQADPDCSPVPTGWRGCHRLALEKRIAALEDSAAHRSP